MTTMLLVFGFLMSLLIGWMGQLVHMDNRQKQSGKSGDMKVYQILRKRFDNKS
jgi:hypothetical protein